MVRQNSVLEHYTRFIDLCEVHVCVCVCVCEHVCVNTCPYECMWKPEVITLSLETESLTELKSIVVLVDKL